MTYDYYQKALAGLELPLAYVDLDLFDANVEDIRARAGDKKIRIASKSIRCVELMCRILASSPQYQGVMCYTATEAVWLSERGLDDLLIAYPTYQFEHIRAVAQALKRGKKIYLMTDLPQHLERIQSIAELEGVEIPVCLDLDMTSQIWGIYFGVRRSSVRDLASLETYLNALRKCPNVRLAGLMGYEAQIAGLGDNAPGKWLMNKIIRLLKKRSIQEVAERRRIIVEHLEKSGYRLDFVNGGGTGSMETTRLESVVTEIAAGSGFYAPILFDSYQQFRHRPAAGYAVEIVRQPYPDTFTCLGGGYVASGGLGMEKIPQPYLPEGASLDKNELAGEVQTPIYYKGEIPLRIGDPIFMRHSKAGELCEHFDRLHLIRNGKVIGSTETYRGAGKCFLG